jgi:hypothetical protein
MPQLLYSWQKISCYLLNKRLFGAESQFGHFEEESIPFKAEVSYVLWIISHLVSVERSLVKLMGIFCLLM